MFRRERAAESFQCLEVGLDVFGGKRAFGTGRHKAQVGFDGPVERHQASDNAGSLQDGIHGIRIETLRIRRSISPAAPVNKVNVNDGDRRYLAVLEALPRLS